MIYLIQSEANPNSKQKKSTKKSRVKEEKMYGAKVFGGHKIGFQSNEEDIESNTKFELRRLKVGEWLYQILLH